MQAYSGAFLLENQVQNLLFSSTSCCQNTRFVVCYLQAQREVGISDKFPRGLICNQQKSKKESMTIFTERLIIRHPKISDAVALNSAIIESIRELKKYMSWANKIPSISDTQDNIENAIRLIETNADIRFLIFSKDNDFIGSSGLHKIDWQIKKAEIGYWIRTTKSGNGFITEAVNAIANYGINELGLQRIEIVCSGSNTKSRRIPEKLGFVLEGILKKHRINGDGTIDDTVYYAKVI